MRKVGLPGTLWDFFKRKRKCLQANYFVCGSLRGNSGGLTSRRRGCRVSGTEGWAPGPQAGDRWQSEFLHAWDLAPALGLPECLGLARGCPCLGDGGGLGEKKCPRAPQPCWVQVPCSQTSQPPPRFQLVKTDQNYLLSVRAQQAL